MLRLVDNVAALVMANTALPNTKSLAVLNNAN